MRALPRLWTACTRQVHGCCCCCCSSSASPPWLVQVPKVTCCPRGFTPARPAATTASSSRVFAHRAALSSFRALRHHSLGCCIRRRCADFIKCSSFMCAPPRRHDSRCGTGKCFDRWLGRALGSRWRLRAGRAQRQPSPFLRQVVQHVWGAGGRAWQMVGGRAWQMQGS